MKCPRCQQENPPQTKFCLECGAPVNVATPSPRSYADLNGEIERLSRALTAALEQQKVSGEILGVISDSPTDLQPVLDAVSENAARLCEASDAVILLVEGSRLRAAAHHGQAFAAAVDRPLTRDGVAGRAVIDRATIHLPDVQATDDYPLAQRLSRADGTRTVLATPLMRQAVAVGAILIRRAEIRPFSDKQVALLKTFADQAVIAIENVRLFKELESKNRDLTAALEQQTATSEILRVIASSPADVAPVFDVILRSAVELSDSEFGVALRYDGELLHLMAHHNQGPEGLAVLQRTYPAPLCVGTPSAQAIARRAPVLVEDAAEETIGQASRVAIARAVGNRSTMSVPMLREGQPIGAITLGRAQPGSYSTKHLAMLQTFADQAVIAIENVRLFTELQEKNRALTEAHGQVTEALEQQTATSEILSVISSSPTDVQPVFEAIARSAVRLCGGVHAGVLRLSDDVLSVVAHENLSAVGADMLLSLYPASPDRAGLVGLAVRQRDIVHSPDVQRDPRSAHPELARRAGYSSVLTVPIMRSGEPIGAIFVTSTAPFSTPQMELLKTFADQAVIAIENVRLFTELQEKNHALTTAHAQVTEALDQQTATAEILRVISSSPTEVQPVFDTIAERAMRLCNANQGLVGTFDGERVHLRALANFDASGAEAMRRVFPIHATQGSVLGRTVMTKTIVQVPSMLDDPEYRLNSLAEVAGFRSALGVPMLKDGNVVGAVAVTSPETRVFTDREIALLQTFADQAVIAIENVRLFNELQEKNRALTQAHAQVTEALERQTATSDILRVMASSPTDTQPVFDTIGENAARLCAARDAQVLQVDGDVLRLVSAYGLPSMPSVRSISRGHAVGRAVIDRQTIHVRDMAQAIAEFPETTAPQHGVQSVLAVPLVRHHVAIGVIRVSRTEIRPFTEAQIALLQTFADQAVIAIENVRLFNETKDALERQTATAEVLRVLSSSPTNVQPVMQTIVDSVIRLADADDAMIGRAEGDQIRWLAAAGTQPGPLQPISRSLPSGRAILDRRTSQVNDISVYGDEFPAVAAAYRKGVRTILATPLLREGNSVGVVLVRRTTVRPFTDQQIALLKTFADQAVIAIENVRLFTELQARNRDLTEALDQQTATSEILRVISQSPTDVQPVFDAILASAVRLLGAYSGSLTRSAGDQIELAALTSTDEAGDAAVRARYPQPLQSEDPQAQALRDRAPLNIADAQTDPRLPEATHAYARARGWRSAVMVPMLRHGEAVGTISVTRRDPGGFTDDEIALLKTFADQAVIAIENSRLLTELHARTQELSRSVEQLTALGEVGRAVSSSLDLETVLTTIVSRAVELSGLDGGVVFEYDDDAEEFVQRAQTETGGALAEARRTNRIRKGEGVLGQTAITLESVQVSDITLPGAYAGRLRENLIESGVRAILAVPMVYEGRLIGCLGVTRNQPGNFPNETIELLRTFATQSALAIQNARLFHEIEVKSRQLEAASQHKSEFLANMSHELRTPLNAIIGFSEVLGERMFGELNEKQDEYLKDIHASGQHLLSLINDILDLSKIEAGRMELELTDFDLSMTIENALTLVRERAARHGIALRHEIDPDLGQIQGDERKLKQVLLNLLSNAIKFTPEGGRIDVRAALVDGMAKVAVADTGVGIAPEDQEAIFEEFRQVGTAAKKVEGTGLGLALSRKFIELHGGRIWVHSQVGEGSRFTFTIPVRHGA